MSKQYSGRLDSVKSYGEGILSGDMMNASEKLQQVRSNVSFRVNSAREMVMGIRDQSAMSPMERRKELMERQKELFGIGGGSDASPSSRRTTPSPSGSIGERSKSDPSGGTPSSEPNTKQGGSPLMSEVNAGTKARAQERGFGQ
jgi:hypothetical protein